MLPIPIYLNIASFLNIFNQIKLSNVCFTLFECFNDNLHFITNFNYTDQLQLFNYNITDNALLHITSLTNLQHLDYHAVLKLLMP
jgi:hypothetical protein